MRISNSDGAQLLPALVGLTSRTVGLGDPPLHEPLQTTPALMAYIETALLR